MISRALICAVLAAIVCLSSLPARAQGIEGVFRDFETICFTYAEQGYSIDVRASIDRLGFQFAQKTDDGEDAYNSTSVQLIIGNKGCAFGMPYLPFARMLEWTQEWVMQNGFMLARTATSQSGGEYWIWHGMNFYVALEEHQFADGTTLSGLILTQD
jgi:hypothetical protein